MTLFFHCASGPPAANPWTSGSKTHGRPRPGTGCLPAISYVQRAPVDLRQQSHGPPAAKPMGDLVLEPAVSLLSPMYKGLPWTSGSKPMGDLVLGPAVSLT